MKILNRAFYDIIDFIGSKPAESGGALFGKVEDDIVLEFIPDIHAKTTRGTYSINTDYLNPIIKKMWEEKGYSLIGIIHSHPYGYSSLSSPDMNYFQDLLTSSISREKFYAPVVFTIPDGGFEIHPHVLDKNGNYLHKSTVELVHEEQLAHAVATDELVSNSPEVEKVQSSTPVLASSGLALNQLLPLANQILGFILKLIFGGIAIWLLISMLPLLQDYFIALLTF